eukprot:TRINITY_DN627_c1_g1_i1.p1 TRINITY_DN627_c1_g1~~TRINITY_DN627_c1_g1_i1.p1  ORF type:complete len:443 (-),score=63.24 TRINITY_DN627_c1_g1_i1:404-1732(-)
MLCRLQHPNIVQLLGFCTSPTHQCLVTEYLQGGSLSENIVGMKTKGDRIEIPLFLKIASDISKGMLCLHTERIIHRDLKSANILVSSLSIDVAVCVKVADFGISTAHVNDREHTRYQGTFSYMAPEVFSGSYTPKVDVYSFGMILWEMLTLEKPWSEIKHPYQIEEQTVQGNRPKIPRDINLLISQLVEDSWDQDPNMRPSFDAILKRIKDISYALGLDGSSASRQNNNPHVIKTSTAKIAMSRSFGGPTSTVSKADDYQTLPITSARMHSSQVVAPNAPNPRAPTSMAHVNQNPRGSMLSGSNNCISPNNNSLNGSRNGSINNTLEPPPNIGPLASSIIATLFTHSETVPWATFANECSNVLNARQDYLTHIKPMLTMIGTDQVSKKLFNEFLYWFSPLKRDESIYEGAEEGAPVETPGVSFSDVCLLTITKFVYSCIELF